MSFNPTDFEDDEDLRRSVRGAARAAAEAYLRLEWGERCPDHYAGCHCCRRWAAFDELFNDDPAAEPPLLAAVWSWVRELEEFAVDLVDVETDDRGGSVGILPPRDEAAHALALEAADALRALAKELDQ